MSFSPQEMVAYQLFVDNLNISLKDFLLYCVHSFDDESEPSPEKDKLNSLRDVFLQAGISALTSNDVNSNWVQVGLEFGNESPSNLIYSRTLSLVQELIAKQTICNFFFMHKPPGLRLRFELPHETNRHDVTEDIYQKVDFWRVEGVIDRFIPGVYEPESHLFGGPASMQSVHQLFTIDSLAWLSFHTRCDSDTHVADPSWALSLIMLRALFTSLGIKDWEDLDVWDRIHRKTGRQLPVDAMKQPRVRNALTEIQARWSHPELGLKELSADAKQIAQNFENKIAPVTYEWRKSYFDTAQAYIGPREAMTFFTIFHWNRAGISFMRQALLTQALWARERI